ncbi:MAG: beta-N-acetylglucosaminidase domain-containing protein [Verrucomicrobiia bacterium]
MDGDAPGEFLAGIIEGFYGPPWTQIERLELFDWMSASGLNTYVYCPKDDLKHRATWRELYSRAETARFSELLAAAKAHRIRFIYGLAPGLDLRYSDDSELARLVARLDQMRRLGCESFALLFDDIPGRMEPADLKRWGSIASAQCHVANEAFDWTRQHAPNGRFLFCPTAYCGRMAQRNLGGEGYLAAIGAGLAPNIDVFWTGPEIISREISVAHVREMQALLRRKPLIWDNLHANDYDGRRFYCGPYDGRASGLRSEVAGLLSNPNTEFPLNYLPIRTLGAFVRCAKEWDARQAYLSAMAEWLPRFGTHRGPANLEDLVLFGDCYYLPHEEGPEAVALLRGVQELLAAGPDEWYGKASEVQRKIRQLGQFCARLAELRDRGLFYALSRRVWELREEMDLLDHYIQSKTEHTDSGARFTSDFHLPGTYRGGMAARLQQLWTQAPDGALTPAGVE